MSENFGSAEKPVRTLRFCVRSNRRPGENAGLVFFARCFDIPSLCTSGNSERAVTIGLQMSAQDRFPGEVIDLVKVDTL